MFWSQISESEIVVQPTLRRRREDVEVEPEMDPTGTPSEFKRADALERLFRLLFPLWIDLDLHFSADIVAGPTFMIPLCDFDMISNKGQAPPNQIVQDSPKIVGFGDGPEGEHFLDAELR